MKTHKDVKFLLPEGDEVGKRDIRGVFVFVIFHPMWIILLCMSIIINSVATLSHDMMNAAHSMQSTRIYYMCEVFFFADTMLGVLHRRWADVRSLRPHRPRPGWHIVLAILTLIPYYELYVLVATFGTRTPLDVTRLKVLPRNVFVFAHVFFRTGNIDSPMVILIKHIFLMCHLSVLVALGWNIVLLAEQRHVADTWLSRSRSQLGVDDDGDAHTNITIVLISVLSFLTQNLAGVAKPVTSLDYICVIVILLIGYPCITLLFYGRLLNIALHHLPHHHHQMDRHLPAPLRIDINLDHFHDALSHSALLRPLRRHPLHRRLLTAAMRERHLPAGERLPPTMGLVYVVAGELQLFAAAHDQRTTPPLATFAAGSVLFEVSARMPAMAAAHAHVAARGACVVHVLRWSRLFRLLAAHPSAGSDILRRVDERIAYARHHRSTDGVVARRCDVARFKRTWRALEASTMMTSSPCSVRYMDLYTLADTAAATRQRSRFLHLACCAAIALNIIVVPYLIAVPHVISAYVFAVGLLLDLLYALELVRAEYVIVDVLACVPADLLMYVIDLPHHACVLRLNRLLFAYKLVALVHDWQKMAAATESGGGFELMKVLVKYTVYYACAIHIGACIAIGMGGGGWFMKNVVGHQHPQAGDADVYWSGWHLSVALLMRLMYVDFTLGSRSEAIMRITFLVVGQSLMAFAFCELVGGGMKAHQRGECARQRIRQLRNALLEAGADDGLVRDVSAHFTFLQRHHECQTQELLMGRMKAHLVNVPLFADLGDDALTHICRVSSIVSFAPQSVVVDLGMPSEYLYVIERGQCQITSNLVDMGCRRRTTRLTAPSAFPVLEFFFDHAALVTVRTLTAVDCIRIPRDVIRTLSTLYKMAYLEAFRNQMTLMQFIQTQPANVEETSKKHVKHWARGIPPVKWYHCRSTINPHGHGFMIWECVKSIVFVLQLLIICLSTNVLFPYTNFVIGIQCVLDVYGVCDIVVRLHLQYFNEEGLLVTASSATRAHYLRHAFAVDVIGVIPFYALSLPMVLFPRNGFFMGYHTYILLTRLLQVYRVHGLLVYVAHSRPWIRIVLYCLYYHTLLAAFISVFFIATCRTDDSRMSITCVNNTTTEVSFSHVVYAQLAIVCSQTTPILWTLYQRWLLWLLAIFVGMGALFHLLAVSDALVGIIAVGAPLHVCTRSHRSAVDRLRRYARAEIVDAQLVRAVIAAHDFHVTHHVDDVELHHFRLADAVRRTLFSRTLASVGVFMQYTPFIDALMPHVHLVHIAAGDVVVQPNDVVATFFMVHAGRLSVSVSSMVLGHLVPASTFGPLDRRRRVTIRVRALVDSQLLIVDAAILRLTARRHPYVEESFRCFERAGRDFNDLKTARGYRVHAPPHHRCSRNFQLFEHVLHAHFIPIASCILIKSIFYVHQVSAPHLFMLIVLVYVYDIIYATRMCLMLAIGEKRHLVHVQGQRGYFRSALFYVDVISLIPWEWPLAIIFTLHPAYFMPWHRFLRVFHFLTYFYARRKSIRCMGIFLVYTSAIFVCLVSTLWMGVSCRNGQCPYYVVVALRTVAIENTTSPLKNELLATLFAVSLLTHGTLDTVAPFSIVQLACFMLLYVLMSLTLVLVLAVTAHCFCALFHAKVVFYQRANELLHKLHERKISPALIRRVSLYFDTLWTAARGDIVPKMVRQAPGYLQQPVLAASYASHLDSHFLFKNAHVDFLRQLHVHVERILLLPAQNIVHEEDADHTMYFIKGGQVAEMTSKFGPERIRTLCAGDSFGELAGCFQLPHIATYTCITRVDLLTLNKSRWSYLLQHFPATREAISDAAVRKFRPADDVVFSL